jgi:hypothetical protein
MNQEQLKQKIAFYFEKLSPEAQAVFSKMEWLEKLKALSQLHALSAEQMETLGTETTLVLLGITHPDEYEKTLGEELHLPKLTLDKIIVEINNSVINPVRSDLYDAFDANDTANTPEEVEVGTKLDERFGQLPKSVQDVVTASNYYGNLYAIAQESGLSIPQMGALEECVTDIITGKAEAGTLKDLIRARVGIDEGKAVKLAVEINEKISRDLRNKLMTEAMPKKEVVTEEKVLESAGIKLVDSREVPIKMPEKNVVVEKLSEQPMQKADLTTPELPAPTNGPMLAQKFSQTFKAPTTKTQYSGEEKPKVTPQSYPKGEDPYRIAPGK